MQPLKPFGRTDPVTLSGDFTFTGDSIRVTFRLDDPDRVVVNPLVDGHWDATTIARADGLWNTTCFEAFWGEAGSDAYWELNLAASGGWNLYRFDAPRTPEPPQRSNDYSLKSLRTTPGALVCELTTALRPRSLDVGLSAVIATAGRTLYYALHHPGPRPDFHDRAGFVLHRAP
ncbi:MAG: DOMON-like domain-containing protein [Proteobacteria bacterium]|nr:DOMON-like domain-containing protein [Pseudomonadota bacterium]